MTGDIAGAILDFGYLTGLWFPGILLARAIGQKSTWASLTVGFLLSTVVVVVLFHLTALFGATDRWWLASKILLLTVLVATTWIAFRRGDRAVMLPLGIALFVTAVAVVMRNLFRLDGYLRGSDQFMVSWISSLAQSGHDPSLFGDVNYVKRGLAFPLLLAQGREGQLLLSITLVILILALISTFLLASSIGTQWNTLGISLGIALVILWLTTPIVWGMAFYTNGHVLMALAVATLASQVVGKSATVRRTPIELVAIFAAGFTIASTRPEGVALALILSLPLFVRPRLETRRQTAWRFVALLGAPLGFVLWIIVTTNLLALSFLATISIGLSVFLVVGVWFLVVSAKTSWHYVIAIVIGISLLALAVLLLVGIPPTFDSLTAFVKNTFLGEGLWGELAGVFAVAFLLHALIKTDKRVTNLVLLTGLAVLFTIAAKMVDGLVAFDSLGGVRLGWGDSTNRSLFHLISLASALFLSLEGLVRNRNGQRFDSLTVGPTRKMGLDPV